jgi:hypothetical protein
MARKTWVYIDGVAIPKEEYEAQQQTNRAHLVMPDIQPYKSMIDGSTITSRSIHRDHLRQHNCIEVGNEKLTAKTPTPPKGLREEIARAVHQRLY